MSSYISIQHYKKIIDLLHRLGFRIAKTVMVKVTIFTKG